MICFHPNGVLETKKNICLCSKCLEDIFTECFNKAGTEIQIKSLKGTVKG